MKRETLFKSGFALVIGAVVASSLINYSTTTSAKTEASTTYVELQDLGKKTDQCVQGSVSTDTPDCQQAAQKAKEVQQQPVVVNIPRRTDEEVKSLIEQTIRENPDLVPRGPRGETYVLTDADKQAIADMVLGRVPVPKDGKAGTDGKNGKDAVVDYEKIVAAVLTLIPVPKDGRDGITPPCMADTRQCRGDKGDLGPAGRGIVSREYLFQGTECVEKTTYTAEPFEQFIAVGTPLCIN